MNSVLRIVQRIDSLFPHQEEGLTEFQSILEEDEGQPERKLREVLEALLLNCQAYLTSVKTSAAGSTAGKTRLDKERLKLCTREVVSTILKSIHPKH